MHVWFMKETIWLHTTLLVRTSAPYPPHSMFAFPNSCLISCTLAGFFIVSETYCLNGSLDLYASITSWGTVVLSNGFDCITPKAVAAIPRTKIVAAITRVAKAFFLVRFKVTSAPTIKKPLSQLPHLSYVILKAEHIIFTHLYYIR
jgi:hypothetical protein